MIKFFRNIRQNLIMENKTSKYLKYAVGEIVLVVIGILIALQINNWNEYQKERNQEYIYLQNLEDDMKGQINYLETFINFETLIIQDASDIMEHYKANNGFYYMDSIYPKLNDLSVRWTFANVNTTLLEMMNSGQINILSNPKLKKELMEFNQTIQHIESNTQNNNTNLIDNIVVPNVINNGSYAFSGYSSQMKNILIGFTNSMSFKTVNESKLKEISDQNMNDAKFELLLINNVLFRYEMAIMQKSGNERLKERATEILKNIQTELKK